MKHWIAALCVALSASVAHAGSSAPFELKASVEYASDANEYLLVYSSNEIDDGPNIYGRVLTGDAAPTGKDIRLSGQTGKMIKPVVAYNPSTHQFLVVWGHKLDDRAEIIGVNVGLDGKIVGSEYRMSFSDLYDQRPAIAYCPGRDTFLVTWTRGTQYNFEKGVSDIYGQFIGGDGNTMQGSNFVIASAAKNQFKSELACDVVNDRFMVVWEDQRNAATQDDIYGQLVSSDGTLVGQNFLVSGTPNVERRPSVAASSKDGTYLVAWEAVQGKDVLVYSQTLDSNGQLLKDPVAMGSDVGGSRNRPSVAYLRSQDVFFVAWDNSAFDNVDDGIWGQFVEHTGKPRQISIPLTTAKENQYRPEVIAAKNVFFSVWTDYRNTADPKAKHHVYEYFGRVIGNDMELSSRWRNAESE
jgi:hypothetical protein